MGSKQEKIIIPELPQTLDPFEQPELPFVKNNHIVPNACLQSALFGMVVKGQRRYLNGQLIVSFTGITIYYTGEQLDQGDLDVFIHAVHLTAQQKERTNPEGLVHFSVRGFLKAIDRKPGKTGQQWLLRSIRRLSASNVEIQIHNKTLRSMFSIYGGSLIHDYFYDPVQKTYYLRVNPSLGALFDRGWTQLCLQQRLRLKGDLTRWLHGIYSSTKKTYPIKVSTLRVLSGSACCRLSDFRRRLKSSLNKMIEIGAITSWEIDQNDKVKVEFNGTSGTS